MKRYSHIFLVFYFLGFVMTFGCETDDDPSPTPNPDCFDLTGNAITEMRDVADFSEITVNGLANIELRNGAFEPITVVANEGMMPFIETTVSGDRLTITYEGCLDADTDGFVTPTYTITLPELTSLKCFGLINVSNEGTLKGDKLEINSHGLENFDLDVEYNTLITSIKGAGTAKLSGKVINQELNVRGAGTYSAFPLESDECTINIWGAGDAEVFVNERLEVDIFGAGRVCYKGQPTTIDTDIDPTGSLDDCN